MLWEEEGFTLYLPHGEASDEVSARYFVRLPQKNQSAETLTEHLHDAEMLLDEAREFWTNWKSFGTTNWSCPGRHGEFPTACARNIQQAREVKNDRLVFQVGPTQYRGLWIVDGNLVKNKPFGGSQAHCCAEPEIPNFGGQETMPRQSECQAGIDEAKNSAAINHAMYEIFAPSNPLWMRLKLILQRQSLFLCHSLLQDKLKPHP